MSTSTATRRTRSQPAARPRRKRPPRGRVLRRRLGFLLAVAFAAVVVGAAVAPWADKAVKEVSLPLRHDDVGQKNGERLDALGAAEGERLGPAEPRQLHVDEGDVGDVLCERGHGLVAVRHLDDLRGRIERLNGRRKVRARRGEVVRDERNQVRPSARRGRRFAKVSHVTVMSIFQKNEGKTETFFVCYREGC
jgi:hypothetical protein